MGSQGPDGANVDLRTHGDRFRPLNWGLLDPFQMA